MNTPVKWELLIIEARGRRSSMRMEGFQTRSETVDAQADHAAKLVADGWEIVERDNALVRLAFSYVGADGAVLSVDEQPAFKLIVRAAGLNAGPPAGLNASHQPE